MNWKKLGEDISSRKVVMIIFFISVFGYISLSEGWFTALILAPAYGMGIMFLVFAISTMTDGSGKEIIHTVLTIIFSIGAFVYITIILHWFPALIFALFYVFIINEIVSWILDLFIEDEKGGW
jgi:hypothetical protein|tara:strand:- start:82 stop:450 length:369 start_codon:yes stop_codon:yes gene_type:complete